ncbi:MAG: response regulator transcription factor [Treponema sp.]|nr:response regulator transcription factor [Treponema sp.]
MMGLFIDNKISILVAARYDEDCRRILASLSECNDFCVAGTGKDEADAIIKSEKLKPDILIMDLQLTEKNGPDIIKIIRRRSSNTAIIVFSEEDEEDHKKSQKLSAMGIASVIGSIDVSASLFIKAGVSGFLLKNNDFGKLALVIRLVSMGGNYISCSISSRVFNAISCINQFPGQFMDADDMFYSPAERGIITSLAKGYSDNEIAKELNLSIGSIRNCLLAIKRKTKIKNRTGIVVFSLLFGLIRLENLCCWKEKINLIFQKISKTDTVPKTMQINISDNACQTKAEK